MTRNRQLAAALVLALGMSGNGLAAEVLTFADAWQLLLGEHPTLAVSAADLEARAADLEQSGRGLNPELVFETENFGGSGEFGGLGEADLTLALSQTWERGGKADSRRAVARAGLAASRNAADLARLDLRADLARSFIEVLVARRHIALADTLALVAEQDRIAVDRRVAAGAENRIAAQRVRLAWFAARRDRERAQQEWQAARIRLGALWNDDHGTFAGLSGDLDAIVPVPDWQEILAGLDTSPTARTAATDIAHARAVTDLARSLGTVNVTTAAGVRHFRGSDDNAFVFSVGLPLTVRDQGKGARRAAAADVARLEAAARAATTDLKSDLSDAWSRLGTSQADILAIRRDMLPAAATAMTEARRAYSQGGYSLTDVLAVRRTWAEWQLAHVDALARHHLAAADLAALLGNPAAVPAQATEERP